MFIQKQKQNPHPWRRLVASPRRERRVLQLGLKGRRTGSTGGQSRAAPAWLLGSIGLGAMTGRRAALGRVWAPMADLLTHWSLHTSLSQRWRGRSAERLSGSVYCEKRNPATSPGLDPVGQAMIFVSGFPGVMWGAVGCAWGLTMSRPLSRNRRWHPTPALLLGKPHGRRSLVGCSPWGRSESDTTERLHCHFSL